MANSITLEGIVAEAVELRATPAGCEVATLELEHDSSRDDIPPFSQFLLRITVVAVGAQVAACRGLTPGSRVVVAGRLNQQRWLRNGKVKWGRLELIASSILPGNDD